VRAPAPDNRGEHRGQRRVLPGAAGHPLSDRTRTRAKNREGLMKAVRLHRYGENPRVENVAEPELTHPLDVIVRIGGAGLCRTDLHIVEGRRRERTGVTLPYKLGHENAGWLHAVVTAVDQVAVSNTVIVHPLVTCSLC